MSSAQDIRNIRVYAAIILAIFALFSLSQILAVFHTANAAAPNTNILGYQGRLLNANGVPVADATASVIFELYSALSGGTCVWSNSSSTCASATARTVTLTDGLFSESLGDTAAGTPYSAISDSIFADNAALYLKVTVNGEALSPRKRILASGYALNSQTLDGYNTTLAGGTSSAVTVLDANGNLQLTGTPQGTDVSQGSLYINPSSATSEVLFGIAVGGTAKFMVTGDGNAALGGDLRVDGGDINSSVALNISSTGGNISLGPSGSGLAYVTSGDDFAIGAGSLVAPFSFDESENRLRIGDGVDDAADPTIVLYASDASDSGTLSYSDDDKFTFSNGNFLHNSLGVLPTTAGAQQREHAVTTTWSGVSGASLGTIELLTSADVATYSGQEGAASDHLVAASKGYLQLNGTSTTLSYGYGVYGRLINTSTNASLIPISGHLVGVNGSFEQSAAETIAHGYGVRGIVSASSGTITNGYGVYGTILSDAGAITNSYAGYFLNNVEGTTRYGVYGFAEGGTANYAGYFAGAAVQIDDDITPNTPVLATGAGDLFITDALEAAGSVTFGDTAGTDAFNFVTAAATTNAATFTMNDLNTGSGLVLARADGSADFLGSMLLVEQHETSVGSHGDALVVQNAGGGNSVGVYVVQSQITNATSGAGGTAVGAHAMVLETTEAGSGDEMMVIRANGEITLAIASDGSVLSDNAFSSSGADYAEYFSTVDASLQQSEVVCHDRDNANMIKRCEAANTEVLGVITPTPGFIGGLPDNGDASLREIVGLTGQIATFATAADGAIAIGDPVTASQTQSGYAGRAQGPVRIIGFALEPLASGTGTIAIYVNPQWYGGDVLASDGSATVLSSSFVLAPMDTATASSTTVASQGLALRGSAWNGSVAVIQSMGLRTNVESANYRLSIENTEGNEVAHVSDAGDLALAGRLYPSDRGTLQTEKYIYYDGSTDPGGDMMRTNAAGWSSGSYDFAEMFPSQDMLAAGEVVVFAQNKEEIRRSTGETYSDAIAGVVSTSPAFLAGENRPGDVPIALAGRVPTYVSAENGAIAIGDPLTTSSKPGYAMKATEAGAIVGYAMEEFQGVTGVITVFIRSSYYDGGPVEEAPIAENTASQLNNLSMLDVAGSLNMNGGSILSVSSLMGIGQQWRIEENGDFFTRGRIVQIVQSYAGDDVETYPAASREQTIELTGTAMLVNGKSRIVFEAIDPSFNDIIATTVAYRVYLTPAGMTGMLAAMDRTNEGFVIQESGTSSGVAVDWLVVAYHKDFPPDVPLVENPPVADVPVAQETSDVIEESIVIEETAEVPVEPIPEPTIEEPIMEVIVEEPPIVEDTQDAPTIEVQEQP